MCEIVLIFKRSESPIEEVSGMGSSEMSTIRQPTMDELQKAQEYYEKHTPSLADTIFLSKVAPTRGEIIDLKVFTVPADVASGKMKTGVNEIHFNEHDVRTCMFKILNIYACRCTRTSPHQKASA